MKIAIIGAGFTGLSAAFYLLKEGNDVHIFEKDLNPGGLAIGYKEKNWNWSLEKHYHHWFTNDNSVLGLAKEINYEVKIKRPKTSILVNGNLYQFDSPINVLKFPLLSLWEKIRMSLSIAFFKIYPFWKTLEGKKASATLSKMMGTRSFNMIWKPQFTNKFGKYYENISLSWFWARIKKRTSSLAYPSGGFLNFAEKLVSEIEKMKGRVYFGTEIIELKEDNKIYLKIKGSDGKDRTENYDKVIVTSPTFLFLKIAPQLPQSYREKTGILKGLGATNLVLRLRKKFLPDDTYWLSVCDENSPVMAIVEHTNFMDKKNYDNEHIVYLGNYKPHNDIYFSMTKEEMLKKFEPYLRKINPEFKKEIIGYELFKAPFAQPIIPTNYSKIIPSFNTPIKNVFLANIEQVYPWDRGTNYAVELGKTVAKLVMQ